MEWPISTLAASQDDTNPEFQDDAEDMKAVNELASKQSGELKQTKRDTIARANSVTVHLSQLN